LTRNKVGITGLPGWAEGLVDQIAITALPLLRRRAVGIDIPRRITLLLTEIIGGRSTTLTGLTLLTLAGLTLLALAGLTLALTLLVLTGLCLLTLTLLCLLALPLLSGLGNLLTGGLGVGKRLLNGLLIGSGILRISDLLAGLLQRLGCGLGIATFEGLSCILQGLGCCRIGSGQLGSLLGQFLGESFTLRRAHLIEAIGQTFELLTQLIESRTWRRLIIRELLKPTGQLFECRLAQIGLRIKLLAEPHFSLSNIGQSFLAITGIAGQLLLQLTQNLL
jgi:hypothetical protein